MRKIKFNNSEFYHVYNRGVDKRMITMCQDDSNRFVQGLIEFNRIAPIGSIYLKSFHNKKTPENQLRFREPKLVHIVAYCLNPNHFHLILEQLVDGGISEFMRRVGGGYANYFNEKYKRSGSLFEGRFKAKHIDKDNYFLHSSCYVNLNNKVHQISGPDSELVRSSWNEYMGKVAEGDKICKTDAILGQFSGVEDYKIFAEDTLVRMIEKKKEDKEIQKILMEED